MCIFNYHWNLYTKFDLFMILHEWDGVPSHVEWAWDPLCVTPLPHCCAPAFSPLSLLSSLSNLTWLLESRQQSRILKTLTLQLPLRISELNEWSQFLERRAKFFHDCRERKLHNISSGAFTSSCCTVQIGKNRTDFSWGLDQMACEAALRVFPHCQFQEKKKITAGLLFWFPIWVTENQPAMRIFKCILLLSSRSKMSK